MHQIAIDTAVHDTASQPQTPRPSDLRLIAVGMWAIAGAFVAAAFIQAPAAVEVTCGLVALGVAVGIGWRAMPRWKGTERGLIGVVVLAAVQSIVVVGLALALGR